MMNILRRVLNLGAHEPASARDRLRAAIAARRPAEEAIAAADAALERVQILIDAAKVAEHAAQTAESEVAAATRAWAEAGASSEVSSVHPALLEKMQRARRAADEAHFQSEGAKSAMAKVQQVADQARSDLSTADFAIDAAVSAVLIEECEPEFEILKQTRMQRLRAFEKIKALEVITRPSWGPAHHFGKTASNSAHQVIATRLHEYRVESPSATEMAQKLQPGDARLREQSEAMAEFALRLRSDPDAAFS
jgi:hypothetical protein